MDLKQIKSKLAAMQQPQEGQKEKRDYTKIFWKPKEEGKYQIRFVPSVKNKSNPFLEVFVHYGVNKYPMFALTNWGEKDPIVEFTKQLRTTSDKENWQLAKKLDPKMRIYAPVVVRGEEDKGVRMWEFGKGIYMQLLGIADDEDYGDFTDVNEGRDFTIEAVRGDIGGRMGLKSSIRVKPKTSPLSNNPSEVNKFLTEQPDVLEVQRKYSFEDMKTILQNWLNPETEEEGDIIDEKSEDFDDEPKTQYSLHKKESKSEKLDKLFSDDLPF